MDGIPLCQALYKYRTKGQSFPQRGNNQSVREEKADGYRPKEQGRAKKQCNNTGKLAGHGFSKPMTLMDGKHFLSDIATKGEFEEVIWRKVMKEGNLKKTARGCFYGAPTKHEGYHKRKYDGDCLKV